MIAIGSTTTRSTATRRLRLHNGRNGNANQRLDGMGREDQKKQRGRECHGKNHCEPGTLRIPTEHRRRRPGKRSHLREESYRVLSTTRPPYNSSADLFLLFTHDPCLNMPPKPASFHDQPLDKRRVKNKLGQQISKTARYPPWQRLARASAQPRRAPRCSPCAPASNRIHQQTLEEFAHRAHSK